MNEHYTLENTYYEIFQPEPMLDNYGKPPPTLPNAWLGNLTLPIHTPSNNHSADFLALNSTQFATLHEVIGAISAPTVHNILRAAFLNAVVKKRSLSCPSSTDRES
jgi:hypothetical protein